MWRRDDVWLTVKNKRELPPQPYSGHILMLIPRKIYENCSYCIHSNFIHIFLIHMNLKRKIIISAPVDTEEPSNFNELNWLVIHSSSALSWWMSKNKNSQRINDLLNTVFWQEVLTSNLDVFEGATFMHEDPKFHFATCKAHSLA